MARDGGRCEIAVDVQLAAPVQVEAAGGAQDAREQGQPAVRRDRQRLRHLGAHGLAEAHAGPPAGQPRERVRERGRVVVVAVGDRPAHDLHAELAQPRDVEVDGDQRVGDDRLGRDEHDVDRLRPDVLVQPLEVVRGAVADRLARLLEQVADVHPGRARGQDRAPQRGHEQRRQRRREERSGTEDDQVGTLDRRDRVRVRGRVARVEEQPAHAVAVGRDRGLARDDPAILHLGDERCRMARRRHDRALDREHAPRHRDGGVERAGDLGQRREEQVAEAVPGELAAREAVLEQLAHEVLVLGERDAGTRGCRRAAASRARAAGVPSCRRRRSA